MGLIGDNTRVKFFRGQNFQQQKEKSSEQQRMAIKAERICSQWGSHFYRGYIKRVNCVTGMINELGGRGRAEKYGLK